MCKEMPVIPVNRVVDTKRIIGKMDGGGGEKAQGVADPQKDPEYLLRYNLRQKSGLRSHCRVANIRDISFWPV
jgi:hypothetical protein